MDISKKLQELGLTLPEPIRPVGSYVPAITSENLLYLSGILPFKKGKLLYTGRVGGAVSVQQAQEASKLTVLNALAIIKESIGLERIKQCIRMNGYIASEENFYDQPAVLNAASDLLKTLFGDAGVHTRTAIGVYALPLNSPVEIDFIFEIKG
ncbi:MAG: RidA family protein [Nitrospirae bacterium]|nr:RidA family protein [Nitrospirota bacterium]